MFLMILTSTSFKNVSLSTWLLSLFDFLFGALVVSLNFLGFECRIKFDFSTKSFRPTEKVIFLYMPA